MTTKNRAYNSGEYQANRKLLLADHPACAIRGPSCTGRATTADHIVSLVNGGDNSLANLRPSCQPCNSHIGGREGRARQLRVMRANRRDHDGFEAGFLEAGPEPASPASASRSGRSRGDGGRSRPMLGDVPGCGRIEPRLSIGMSGESSYGPEVAMWAAKHMPFELMAWNRQVLDELLVTKGGRLLHRRGLVSVARQNSKTSLATALAGWWLDEHADRCGPQTLTWTAHDLRLAELAFFALTRMLDHRVVRTSSSYGRQRLHLDNGSEFHVQAATLGAGHGLSIDCAVVDETWRVMQAAVDHGLAPAQRARPQPLMLCLSTAGDESSVLLREWRERGLTMIEARQATSMYFAEWSPPPGVDYADPQWWSWANPALGTTIDAETLLDEYNSPNRNAFLRASLNLWIQSDASWLAPGLWDRCRARSFPEPTGGVVACEVAQGGDRFYATRAFQLDGVSYVAPLCVTEHEDELWSAVEAVYASLDAVLVTPTLQHRVPTSWRKLGTVGLRELARAVPILLAMLTAGQVSHDGSELLAEHVGRAVATRQAGLSTAHSSGSIELARTMVWAVAAASRPSASRRPAMGVARTG